MFYIYMCIYDFDILFGLSNSVISFLMWCYFYHISRNHIQTNKNKCLVVVVVVFQENYERMQVLVDELKKRTEKIKLGRCEHMTD